MTAAEILGKLEILQENLEKLAKIPQDTYEDFASDFRNVDSALHRLQTGIQALIDVASYACATHGLGAPTTSADALVRLEKAGHLPAGSGDRFTPIFGFRNRIVHLYDGVDDQIVYRFLTTERDDLRELGRLLAAVLE